MPRQEQRKLAWLMCLHRSIRSSIPCELRRNANMPAVYSPLLSSSSLTFIPDTSCYELPRPLKSPFVPQKTPKRMKHSDGCIPPLVFYLLLGSLLCALSPKCHSLRLSSENRPQQRSAPLRLPYRPSTSTPSNNIQTGSTSADVISWMRHSTSQVTNAVAQGLGRRSQIYSHYSSPTPAWRDLEIRNCFTGAVPDDMLSQNDVRKLEEDTFSTTSSRRKFRRTRRNRFLTSFAAYQTKSQRGQQHDPHWLRTRRNIGMTSSTTLPTSTLTNRTRMSQASVTVHRLGIRSNFIVVDQGFVRTRLRYFIQLHEAISGTYKLDFEIRMNPNYPPIYIGTVEDVCTYWPADAPGSQCSLEKKRFYQREQICLCHMPPGIYSQRLKLNFGGLLDGMNMPQFLMNFLFNGQHIKLYLTVRLQSAENVTRACVQSSLPVYFRSA